MDKEKTPKQKAPERQAESGIDIGGLNSLAAERARQWLEDDGLIPRDLKCLTGALKDISDIAQKTGEGAKPPDIVITGLDDED